jgi:6-pyruvoyltetrahydropterin/6-carboxytetrahydropterin synthase
MMFLLSLLILWVFSGFDNKILWIVQADADAFHLPFKLGIRDSFMIAHSFRHEDFGPAQNLHGATYTCDVEFHCSQLQSPQNWVMDIGKASGILSKVLSMYHLKNLDDIFTNGELTTTEFMAQQIHKHLIECIQTESIPFQGKICVKLWESHKAWASYEEFV